MSIPETHHNRELSRTYAQFDIDAEQTTHHTGGFLNCDNLGFCRQLGGVISGNLINIEESDGTSHLVSRDSLEKFLLRNSDLSGLQGAGFASEMLQEALSTFENNVRAIKNSMATIQELNIDRHTLLHALKKAGVFPENIHIETDFETAVFKNKEIRLQLLKPDIATIVASALEELPTQNEPEQTGTPVTALPSIDLHEILQETDCDAQLKALCRTRPKEFGEAIQIAFKDGLKMEQKIALRKFLTAEFPDHAAYMEYSINAEKAADYAERYIMPTGIETIIAYLKQKTNNPITLPCTVCPSFTAFTNTMKQLAQGEDIPLPQTFVIRCYKYNFKIQPKDDRDLSKHMTAVYIDRSPDGKIRILSTDSTNPEWLSLRRGLHQLVSEMAKEKVNVELIYFDLYRQYDEHNCAIFSLNDIIQFCQNQKRLDDFLSQVEMQTTLAEIPGRGDKKASIKVGNAKLLPFGFIFPLQSLSAMNKYVAAYKEKYNVEEREEAKFEKTKRAHVEVDVVDQKTKETTRKKQNLYAERRGDKFEGLLWNKIISQSHKEIHHAIR